MGAVDHDLHAIKAQALAHCAFTKFYVAARGVINPRGLTDELRTYHADVFLQLRLYSVFDLVRQLGAVG